MVVSVAFDLLVVFPSRACALGHWWPQIATDTHQRLSIFHYNEQVKLVVALSVLPQNDLFWSVHLEAEALVWYNWFSTTKYWNTASIKLYFFSFLFDLD